MLGMFYGIGVGPGDPELLTLKAVKVLGCVSHVFAASSSKNDYSLAHSIVAGHLPAGVQVDRLAFPMTYNSDPIPPDKRAHFDRLKCVREAKVLIADEFIFSRPGPRCVDAVEQLAAALHPERFGK
jgi:precorrin-2/cobalt-factor-2 C20-methyltransferase